MNQTEKNDILEITGVSNKVVTCPDCGAKWNSTSVLACPICEYKKSLMSVKETIFTLQPRFEITDWAREQIQGITSRDRTREIVRIRDGHKCRKCGKVWQPGNRKFDCHHIEGCGLKSRKYDRLEDVSSMVTLCHRCHMTLESVKYRMMTKSSPRPNKPIKQGEFHPQLMPLAD